jgi:ATP-dependent helicase Lhr and Lhr-like helicase
MEDGGWVRRGMFVAGLGAAQFAMPAAVDMLRSLRSEPETPEVLFLAATDPANPYGTLLPWPRRDGVEPEPVAATTSDAATAELRPADKLPTPPHGMSRTSGAGVILINGKLTAFLRRRSQEIQVFLPDADPERTRYARELAKKLAELAIRRQGRKTGLMIGTINGEPARDHFLARFLEESGFFSSAFGYQMRRISPIAMAAAQESVEPEADSEDDADEADSDASETA